MMKVVLIGDSLRLHYQPFVAKALAGEVDVWGPAENCGSSREIRERLQDWVLAREPDVLHLNCGLHDLRHDPDSPTPAVSPEEYGANIEHILTVVAARLRTRVIWATITPINQVWHESNRASRRYEADVVAYNAVARAVVERFGAEINDLYAAVTDAGTNALLKHDGVHFTDEGYRFLGHQVTGAVRRTLAD